ncbi:MAG: hypothetical protein JO363_05700 [Solirubrobacterales bacterium]|nr:hypothetical protein [Solirubrobacterales bacterium]
MPRLTDEPALSFWIRYVEREGALVEDQGDHALVLLPDALRQDSGLPEEATITANPDVAREDGATLLIAGHPEVERAAAAVLADGDTGYGYLPWPASRPPTRSTLEARARELVSVEHGRIDAAGEPIAAYLPLLRVGAMVSYTASLALRFHEQEEVWVDARSGMALSERLVSAVRGRALLPVPDGARRRLEADLTAAIPAAHRQLEERALRRESSRASHARRALDTELARANAYYASALESIARRRAKAAPDRVRLLDAQAKAASAERDRRCREIEDEHRLRHELRPFRLRLEHLPAFILPVEVRRGTRRFGFELTWVPGAGEFAPVRCPACGAPEPLVATRERLGCQACTAPSGSSPRESAAAPSASSSSSMSTRGSTSSDSGADHESLARRRHADVVPARPIPDAPRARPNRSQFTGSLSANARLPRRPSSPAQVKRTGNKLAFAFWDCVANGARWPRQKTVRDSPLRAVQRLYGRAGPLYAIGVPPGGYVEEMAASTYPSQPGAPELTVGSVKASGHVYPYAMFWWIAAGKPVVGEIMPAPHPLALPPLDGETAEIGRRLRERAPAPIVALDPVALLLWRAGLHRHGMPFAIRCLAVWWRLPDRCDPAPSDEAVAGLVASAVARAAGITRARSETAAGSEAGRVLTTLTEQALEAGLRIDPERGW